MTITDRYISMLLPSFAAAVAGGSATPTTFEKGNGWKFPCPFCCEKVSKTYKKKTQCAALIPNGNYSYVFRCCRKKSMECYDNMLFPIFLKTYNPKLFCSIIEIVKKQEALAKVMTLENTTTLETTNERT